MNIVLLSGGSGKRLWPLSNDVRSKWSPAAATPFRRLPLPPLTSGA